MICTDRRSSCFTRFFGAFGVKTVTEDFTDVAALRAKAFEIKPSVLICETLSNPLLKVCDVEECAAIAHETGAKLIVDNTFATPYLSRPLDLGADFVVHSATKYLGGHADATGGVVVAKEDFDKPALLGALTLAGGILSPWEAHSILRGIKTLGLRMEKQCANAERLAAQLKKLPQIADVIYPKFFEGTQANALENTFHGSEYGAIVTIRLKRRHTRRGLQVFEFFEIVHACSKRRRSFHGHRPSGDRDASRAVAGKACGDRDNRRPDPHLGRHRGR